MSNKPAFALGVLTVFGVNAIINLATEIVCCRVRKKLGNYGIIFGIDMTKEDGKNEHKNAKENEKEGS